jgi:hypothetical protein
MKKNGRPRTFETPADFEILADAYFQNCEESGRPISWTGLCLAVGMNSRSGLDRYRKAEHGDAFCGPVKKALLRVENYYEEQAEGSRAIFALKNFGWSDRQEVNFNSKTDLGPSVIRIVGWTGEDEEGSS